MNEYATLVGLIIIAIAMSTLAVVVGLTVLHRLAELIRGQAEQTHALHLVTAPEAVRRGDSPFRGYAKPLSDEPRGREIDRTTRP